MILDQDACFRALQTRDGRFDGRIFVAVRTTGIYCRPVCPARTPLRRNVTFYESAAAAQENGYRPCLRCRPETAPDLGAWNGTSNTVNRAMRLIDQGVLDQVDVENLAERLGVGERHLRRLFKQHLGASPVAVAQTRRVLLAKQLIHETLLPMSEIALASGFGSIRRFNETFQQLYGKPPSALRRLNGPEHSVGSGEIVLKLRYKPPLDWPAMLAFFRQRLIVPIEKVEGDSYMRTISLQGKTGTIKLSLGSSSEINAAIDFPDLSLLPDIIFRIRRVLDLGLAPNAINKDLGSDPILKPLVDARPGLRSPGAWDVFEMAIRAVLGQQISVAGAATIGARLCVRLGDVQERFEEQGLTHTFPSAEAIAGADLTGIGMPGARVRTLQGLARASLADPALLSPSQSLEEAVETLCALPGIGPWSAHYIALRALREPDAFPSSDIGLINAWARLTGNRPTASELEAQAERWRPWRGYAAQHLWASLG